MSGSVQVCDGAMLCFVFEKLRSHCHVNMVLWISAAFVGVVGGGGDKCVCVGGGGVGRQAGRLAHLS